MAAQTPYAPELAGCAAPSPIVDRAALERRLHVKLADWRGLLTRNLTSGRDVLRLLLAGPIRFTPVNEDRRRGYRFAGSIALDRMIGGVLETYPNGTSPGGTADGWPMPLRGYFDRRAA
jgi:hypothetical protein